MRSVFSIVRTLSIGTLFTALAAAGAMAQANLVSDQTDYAPGSTATLSGTGFAPDETVTLQVLHADGTMSTGADHDPWDVSADAAGTFVATWHVCEDDCVGSLLTATADQASGAHAETSFTDASPNTCTGCEPSLKDGNVPSTGTAVVDGIESSGEWSASDLWANMYTAGNATKPLLSKAYVKFTCNADKTISTVYVLVKAEPGQLIDVDSPCGSDSWIKYCNGDSLDKAVDSCDTPSTTTHPATNGHFSYGGVVGATATLYEASFTLPAGSTYNVAPHAHVTPAGGGTTNTSAAVGFPGNGICMTLLCSDEGGCTPCALACPSDVTIDCGDSTDPSSTGTPTGCANATFADAVTPGNCTGSYTISRTWTAPDGCGGTSTCTQTITVTDTTGPSLSRPGDVAVDCSASTDPAATGTAGASDDCSGVLDISYSDSDEPGNCAGNHVITRTWTARDNCGNSSSCEQIITVSDTTPPSIDCPGDLALDCAASTDPADTGTASATDDCSGVADITHSDADAPGDCAGNHVITRTWTATDNCGNTSSCDQIITVTDTTPPSIDCPADVTANGGGACCVPVAIGTATASDDCSGVDITSNAPATFCVGDTTVTWTATDGCGLASTCEQTVTVLGQICATKFYDANANGIRDNGEVGVAGWQIVVNPGNLTQTTGADGTTCFNVAAGNYTVTEGTPSQTNWVHTTATTKSVTVGAGSCAPSVSFGNYCFSAPSKGLTLGYWTNKNGEKILQMHDAMVSGPYIATPNWRCILNALNLKNANGSDFVIPTTGSFANAYAIFKTWLSGANATNMAYMLSAQLAATTLDVKYNGLSDGQGVIVPGGVKTLANVCIVPFLSVTQAISCGAPPLLALTALPGSTACGCGSNDGLVSIGDLRSRADCLLGAYPNATAASTQRTYEECVKDILDMINNNGNPTGASAYPCGGVSQYINGPGTCQASF